MRDSAVRSRQSVQMMLVLVFFGLVLQAGGALRGAIPGAEREALIALYEQAGGPGWVNRSNWRTPDDTAFGEPGTECTWFGVYCDPDGAHVIGLYLLSNNLDGTFPPELAALTHLQWLDFSSNHLRGKIPPGLDALAGLTTLSLGFNELSGPIPRQLGNLTGLTLLNLTFNELTGPIPPELGQLEHLQSLYLGYNRLEGPIPPELGQLGALWTLDLSANQLGGAIPPELGALSKLIYLMLSQNHFNGSIPPELGNLASLQGLYLFDNRLSGPVPAELAQMDRLTILILQGNQLTGSIPPELGSMGALQWLWLSENQFSGPIPPELGHLANLQALSLGANRLDGPIPAELGLLSKLEYLYLYNNQLTGEIPAELGRLAALKELWLLGNTLTGPLPESLGNLANLEVLRLSVNGCSGPVPASLGRLSKLKRLWLDGNLFSGPLPASLLQLEQLEAPTDYWQSGLNLNFNALFTFDPALRAFLDSRHWNGDFQSTQAVAPAEFQALSTSSTAARLRWVPNAAPIAGGGYEILQQLAGRERDEVFHTVPGPRTDQYRACLCPGRAYDVQIRSFYEPHRYNRNQVASTWTHSIRLTTPPARAKVDVYRRPEQTGTVNPALASQVLPASELIFALHPDSFPDASPADPVIIALALPDRAILSQTLATGRVGATGSGPTAGELLPDLAVLPFVLEPGGQPVPAGPGIPLPDIGPQAVQLFRYVSGEDVILIRINESTQSWVGEQPEVFFGFAIGLGSGLWPNSPNSNWGPGGLGRQAATLFYADLRQFTFDPLDPIFPIQLCAFWQRSGEGLSTAFEPEDISLFRLAPDPAGESLSGASSRLTELVRDFALADLDGDGFQDMIVAGGSAPVLRWFFGQPDGTFAGGGETALDAVPATVDAADLSGDGRPDLLVGTMAGTLEKYRWEDLFTEGRKSLLHAVPAARVPLAGIPVDSLIADVDRDGTGDHVSLSTDSASVTVLFGDGFSPPGQTLALDGAPTALADGDFDGDGHPDLAVASSVSNSLHVLLNDGGGGFGLATLPGICNSPTDLASADFNGDGRGDLAVANTGDASLATLEAGPGGAFNAATARRIFFQKHPSALQADNFDGQHFADVLVGFSDWYKLAVCVSDASGLLNHSFNVNTIGDVIQSPGSGLTLSEDNVVVVAGGTSYGGVSSASGVAAIGSHGYSVFHFPRSKDLSFSVVNLGASAALLNLELYRSDVSTLGGGQKSYRGAMLDARTVPGGVPARTQFARYLTDPALLGNQADDLNHWARGFVTDQDVHGLWLANNGLDLTYLDGARLSDGWDAMSDFVFPVIFPGGGDTSEITLINPSHETIHASIEVFSQEGLRKSTRETVLESRGRAVLPAGELQAGLAPGDYVRVRSDRPVIGVEMFGHPGSLAVLPGLRAGEAPADLFSPHLAVGDFGVLYESVLTLVNTGLSAATVTVTRFDDLGDARQTAEVELPALGKRDLDLAGWLALTQPTTGYLEVDPGLAAGIVGCMTFGETGDGQFISSLPLERAEHNTFLLGHIANGALGDLTFFTGLAILLPETDPAVEADVQVIAMDQNGLLLDSRRLLLGGYDQDGSRRDKRQVFLLDQLMPGLGAIFGGYLVVENRNASDGILVFELFGDTGLTFLSAVPAAPLD